MEKIYNTAKIPKYEDPSKMVTYEPYIKDFFAKSDDTDKLEYYWTQFRASTGEKIRELYLEYVELTNESAR